MKPKKAKNPAVAARKLARARAVAGRCYQIDVAPPAWARHRLWLAAKGRAA